MKRIEIHLTEKEVEELDSIAKKDGRKRKPFVENEIRKIITKNSQSKPS
jgi:metal-responsive CopG/Arc/MetJ family transcriptional regulator